MKRYKVGYQLAFLHWMLEWRGGWQSKDEKIRRKYFKAFADLQRPPNWADAEAEALLELLAEAAEEAFR